MLKIKETDNCEVEFDIVSKQSLASTDFAPKLDKIWPWFNVQMSDRGILHKGEFFDLMNQTCKDNEIGDQERILS